jgi:transcriptional regulator with PAS, ATPase and Fis domain
MRGLRRPLKTFRLDRWHQLKGIEAKADPYAGLRDQVSASLIRALTEMCDGAVIVDQDARVTWIQDKYRALLGIDPDCRVVGQPVEDVIPNSQLRSVVETGRPILLDIMDFGSQHFVVTRIPLADEKGKITGAVGFVLYDRPDRLQPLIAKFEILTTELERTRRELVEARRPRYSFSQFIGTSEESQQVKWAAHRASQHEASVLVLGETGTGKELLSQSIHGASRRAAHPFVAINIAAIPETLVEAEFFGVSPGAFTGADRKPRKGKFELAHKGTLFLDEIGDCPLEVQAKLLRVLQEQEIEPLGSNRLVPVDVRIIAATSVDLVTRIQEGRFRSDLYFRLNVLPIAIPPLRDRPTDIASIAEVLLEDIAQRSGQTLRRLSIDALPVLAAYHWPGNVRELRNILERVCLDADGPLIEARHLAGVMPRRPVTLLTPRTQMPSLRETVAAAERVALAEALRLAGGNRNEAARLLGISRSHLYAKLDESGQ